MELSKILLVFAFVIATIAAAWWIEPLPWHGRLIAASLAFYFASLLF